MLWTIGGIYIFYVEIFYKKIINIIKGEVVSDDANLWYYLIYYLVLFKNFKKNNLKSI